MSKGKSPTIRRPARKTRTAKSLDKAIEAYEEHMEAKSVAEYLKLIELRKELEGDATKEIKVTWVEPEKAEPSGEE